MQRIYLDNNATTPLLPEVLEAMYRCQKELFGNPSSDHAAGEEAREAVDSARAELGAFLGCAPETLIFTSGGTESNNCAILSAAAALPKRRHLVCSAVEHGSVLAPLRHLENLGYELDILPVDQEGRLDMTAFDAALRADTCLVSIMAANNETGVLFPIETIGAACRKKGVLFHSDAAQFSAKAQLDLSRLPVDMLTVAGHKMHGPKGVGALYIRRGVPFVPMMRGAGQEGGRRAGTENVPGIVGLGTASRLAARDMVARLTHMQALREKLERGLLEKIARCRINGAGAPRLPNTVNASFAAAAAIPIIQELDMQGIAVSAQSACHSGDVTPSPVLVAMKLPEEYLHASLRISVSPCNTTVEIDRLLAVLPQIVERSRRIAI